MAASNSSGTAQIYRLKVQKETSIPYFVRQEKNGDTWMDTESFQNIEGYLKSVSMESYTYEGKTKYSLKVVMNDNMTDEKIIISFYMDNYTRTMLNCIAGAEDLSKVVRLEARKWGKSEKKYPTIFVKVDNQTVKWKYDLKEIPEVEKTTNKKGETVAWDDTDVNNFYKNVIDIDIMPKLNNTSTVQHTSTQNTSANIEPKTNWEAPDDLPF